jgi:zinc transport system substrate-binding protein
MRPNWLAAIIFLLLSAGATAAPRVVVTVAPVHSLVAGVMQGVAEPRLLLPPGASPHSYSLLPSDARGLTRADLVVWIGEDLELFLEKPLRTLSGDAQILKVTGIPGLTLLEADASEHQDAHGHRQHAHDPHVWLDPHNAVRIVEAVADTISRIDPEHAAVYRKNALTQLERLQALDREIAQAVAPVRDKPFLVFHDAYKYFERRYGLRSAGALTASPDRPPGARTVAAARDRIRSANVGCVFREPQFEPSLAQAVVRGTDARIAVLDPLGADLAPGPSAYFQLIRNLTHSLVGCLAR